MAMDMAKFSDKTVNANTALFADFSDSQTRFRSEGYPDAIKAMRAGKIRNGPGVIKSV